MKIRGNAAHIAEKYAALARDAQAAGDSIMAENFLQHAEHYNRIIMAAQAQSASQQPSEGANGSGNHRAQNDQSDEGNDQSDEDSSDSENEAEMRAVESSKETPAPKPNGRARRGASKDRSGQQPGDTAQAEAQQGDDMTPESDNAAA